MSSRKLRDKVASKLMLLVTLFSCLIVFAIVLTLVYQSIPLLTIQPITKTLFSTSWNPLDGQFGFAPFIAGTLWVTIVSMCLSIPPSLLTSIYLAEYASNKLRQIVKPLIDLLAGIPSVIFGLVGILVIVPLVRNDIAPFFGVYTTGYNILTASIVLAIMVFPVMISISVEVMKGVPQAFRNASMGMGATKWQTVKKVVIPTSLPGLTAAIILGFGRAFGETIAVLMLVGNVAKLPSSIFSPAYPLPALIANNFGDMMSVPSYDSALMFAAVILLVIVIVFSILSQIVLAKLKKV